MNFSMNLNNIKNIHRQLDDRIHLNTYSNYNNISIQGYN